MKTVILVVEHIQAQIEKARKAIEENYPKMIVATSTNIKDSSEFIVEMKDSIAGVIVNLDCPIKNSSEDENSKFNGLSIVALCVEHNIPIVVQSNVNKYFNKYLYNILRVFAEHKNYRYSEIPFNPFIKEHVTWERALVRLMSLHKS